MYEAVFILFGWALGFTLGFTLTRLHMDRKHRAAVRELLYDFHQHQGAPR